MESTQRLLDGHVKDDHGDGEMSGSLEDNDDVKATDNGRRKKQQSPTKRRKIEHESSLLFEVLLLAWRRFSCSSPRISKCCLAPTHAHKASPSSKLFGTASHEFDKGWLKARSQ